MKGQLILFPDSLPAVDYQPLYLKVKEQIDKDFHPYGALPKAPAQLSAEWLFTELKSLIQRVMQQNMTGWTAVIYRIDISESTLQRELIGLAGDEKWNKLTLLILEREAKKVWMRQQFS
ncbi:MAG TPA: hypothetical protein VIK71_05330 [Flavobacteriales bacterium]